MGFYFRKSARFGPFRVNFSTSGVGVSVGERREAVAKLDERSLLALSINCALARAYKRRRKPLDSLVERASRVVACA
jgi:hypothetical protein